MTRAIATFMKTIAEEEVTIAGTFDVTYMESGTSALRLTDPRDQQFNRIGIDDATIIYLSLPLRIEDPQIRVPCGHLLPHPGRGGKVITCPYDGRVWRVWQKDGETLVEEHGNWRKGQNT